MKKIRTSIIPILFTLTPLWAHGDPSLSREPDIPLTSDHHYSQQSLIRLATSDSAFSWWVKNGLRVELHEDYLVYDPWPNAHPVRRTVVLHPGDGSNPPVARIFLTGQFGTNGALYSSLQITQRVDLYSTVNTMTPAPIDPAEPELAKLDPANHPTPEILFTFELAVDTPLNEREAIEAIQPVILYLKNHPLVAIELKGHVGFEDPREPEGEGPAIWNRNHSDPKFRHLGELMLARTEYVKRVMVAAGIDSSRISSAKGSSKNTPKNRKITVRYF